MQRRSFLAGILAAATAPAFVRASVLMPIQQPIWVPPLVDFDATSMDPRGWPRGILGEALTGGRLRIYTGAQPSHAGAVPTGTLLCELTGNMDALGGLSLAGPIVASGLAARFEGLVGGRSVSGKIGTAFDDADLRMNNASFVSGAMVTIPDATSLFQPLEVSR